MRNLFLVLFTVGCVLESSAQEGSSFYFSGPQPSDGQSLGWFPEQYHGDYVSKKDSLRTLHINNDSAWFKIITLVVMSKQEIQEADGLELRDSLLYGIYRDRPVEVLSLRDTVIFGIESFYTLFKMTDSTVLRRAGDDVIMNVREKNGYWTGIHMSKIDGKQELEIAYVDHELGWELIGKQKKLKKKSVQNETLWLLDIVMKDMGAFIANNGFNIKDHFLKK